MLTMNRAYISRTLGAQNNSSLHSSIWLCLYGQEPTDLSDDLSQARVAHDQPAPGSDAVGLVLELLRVNIIEILEPGGRR